MKWLPWIALMGSGLVLLSGCSSPAYLVTGKGWKTLPHLGRAYQQAVQLHYTSGVTALQQAAASEEAVIRLQPHSAAAYARLAKIFWHLGQPGSALQAAARAQALAPQSDIYGVSYGFLAWRAGHRSLARRVWQKTIAAHPSAWQAWDGMARSDLSARRWSQTEAALQQALAVGGPQGLTYETWGRLRQAQGHLDQALIFFEDAKAAQPRWWLPLADIATIERQKGLTTSAAKVLHQALQLDPGNGKLWWQLQSLTPELP